MKRIGQKITLVTLVVLIACLLTGCVKLEANFTVKSNGQVDLDMVLAISESFGSFSDTAYALSDEQVEKLEEEGFTYYPYDQDGYIGYRLVGENIGDKLSDTGIFGDEEIITKSGNKVTLNVPSSLWSTSDDSSDSSSNSLSGKSLLSTSGATMNVSLTLPKGCKVTSSNATNVSEDGLTLTWDLLAMSDNEGIYAEFELPSVQNGILFVAIGAVIVAAIVAFVLIRYNKKQKAADCADKFGTNEVNPNVPVPSNAENQQMENIAENTDENI
jgi:hypothetical protein